MAPSVSSNFTQLFFFSWTKGAGWSCLPLLKRRESFNILFCILLPQITLSNLRLAGNLEILILIRRISIAKGEGALGHILCSGRGSRVNCNALESNKVRDFLKCIQKNKLGQRARCNFSRSFLLRLHCPRRDSGYVFHLQISSCGLAKFSAWLLTWKSLEPRVIKLILYRPGDFSVYRVQPRGPGPCLCFGMCRGRLYSGDLFILANLAELPCAT